MSTKQEAWIKASTSHAGGRRLRCCELSLALLHFSSSNFVSANGCNHLGLQLGGLLLRSLKRLAGLGNPTQGATQRNFEGLGVRQLGFDRFNLLLKPRRRMGTQRIVGQLRLGTRKSLKLRFECLNGFLPAQRRHARARDAVRRKDRPSHRRR